MDRKKMKRIPDEQMFEVTGGIYQRSAAVNSAAAPQTLAAVNSAAAPQTLAAAAAGRDLAEKLPAAPGTPYVGGTLPAAAGTAVQADTLDGVSGTDPADEKSFFII